MGFGPQGQQAYRKLVNFSLWLPAPRGLEKVPSFPETCSAGPFPGGGEEGGHRRDGHLQGCFLSAPGTQSRRFAVASGAGRL